MADQVGMLFISDQDGTREVPTYTCAHCCRVVVMHPGRTRPRAFCRCCGRWICETTRECAEDCTPLDELANDGFEAAQKWLPKTIR